MKMMMARKTYQELLLINTAVITPKRGGVSILSCG